MTSLRIRVAAVCHKNGSILLVEHEKDGKRYWLLPGGGMRVGESKEDALIREVFEETSVKVRPERQLCICESISPDRSRHIVHLLFEAKHISGEPGNSSDPRVRRAAFTPVNSLDKLTVYPPIQAWLQKRLCDGFTDVTEYLGAMWA